MSLKILRASCWVPFFWLAWYISGLDPQNPLFDQWALVEFYRDVKMGDAGWRDLLEPHNNVHQIGFARLVLTAVALTSGLDFKAEIWLSMIIVIATVFVMGKMMDRAGVGDEPAVHIARLFCSVLLCSPVIYWPWVWSVGFFHFLVNLAIIGAASLLARGTQGEPMSRNILLAMVCCTVASTTRAEGLASWLILSPQLFSYTQTLPRRITWRLAWFSGALLSGLLFAYSVAYLSQSQALPAPKIGSTLEDLMLSGLNALGLIGRPLGAGLQPLASPDIPDPLLFMPIGALLTVAFLWLAWLQSRAQPSAIRDVAVAFIGVGIFGFCFSGATMLARVSIGAFAPFRPMMYSVTSLLVFMSVVHLGALRWSTHRARASNFERRALIGSAIAIPLLLSAGYVVVGGDALERRTRSVGSGDCWELIPHLAERNLCFFGLPDTRQVEMFERSGFRHTRKDVIKLEPTADPTWGAIEPQVSQHAGVFNRGVRGWVEPVAEGERPSVFIDIDGGLVGRALVEPEENGRWRFSGKLHWPEDRSGEARAFLYDRSGGRLLPLSGKAILPPEEKQEEE